jgi:hypothetical protein
MSSESGTPALPKRIWTQWRRAAHAIGVVQTRFLMLVIYVLVVVPTGVLMKISNDPLHLKPPKDTNCQPTRQEERNVENARRQF